MSSLEDRLNALESRLSSRAAEVESRIASRLGHVSASEKGDVAKPGVRTEAAGFVKAASPRDTGVRYGLFVGVNEYATYPDGHQPGKLYGCVADARNVRDACHELGGWSDSKCRLLEDRGATRAAIRSVLANLASTAKAGDIVFYFHSSHGGHDPSAGPDNDTFLCAYDRPYFESEIWADLASFREGVRLVCVVDACHSGGLIGKDAAALRPPDELLRRVEARFKTSTRPSGGIRLEDIGWITAAAGAQYSLDAGKIGGQFATRTLVNEGWRAGAADGYTDAILAMGGESAVQSAQAATALPAMAVPQPVGKATFLDLALYACRTWKDRFSSSEEGLLQHIPQFFNPGLLHSVIAGRTGVSS
jgi:hypothetical protein